ncbi:cyclase/dehydrase, partial [Vararia minispora EC-137]
DVQTYREYKLMPYSRKQLYSIVADVASYPRFVPYCADARILSAPAPLSGTRGTRMEAELAVAFLGFRETYVSTVTCHPYESVEAVASSATPLFKSLTTTWGFAPAPGHAPSSAPSPDSAPDDDAAPTMLTLDLAYAFASPLHAAAAHAFFGQVSRAMVQAFEARCLRVYGPG